MSRMCMIGGIIFEVVANAVTLAAESGVTMVSGLAAAATLAAATWHCWSAMQSKFAAPSSLWE